MMDLHPIQGEVKIPVLLIAYKLGKIPLDGPLHLNADLNFFLPINFTLNLLAFIQYSK